MSEPVTISEARLPGLEAERYRAISDLMTHYAYAVQFTAEGEVEFEWVSGDLQQLTGWSLEELGARWQQLAHLDDLPVMWESAQRLFAGEPAVAEFRMRHASGDWLWLRGHARRTTPGSADNEGQEMRVVGALVEITEQKLAEISLRESEERLRLAIDAATMGAWRWDVVADRIELDGRGPLSIVAGKVIDSLATLREHIVPDDLPRFDAEIGRALASSDEFHLEFRLSIPEDVPRWVEIHGKVISDSQGRPRWLTGIGLDTTVRRRLEDEVRRQRDQLAHLARLSTMGEMIAGIAHEINQPLHAISNFASACLNSLPSEGTPVTPQVRQWLRQISDQAAHAAQIVQRWRNFAQRQPLDRRPIQLIPILREALTLLAHEARRYHIKMSFATGLNPAEVSGDPLQLQQVLVNLLRNAIEALRDARIPDPLVSLSLDVGELQVLISVEDNGPGLDGEMEQYFQPFSTTKPEGLGLGLTISRTIVEAHDGRLWAERTSRGGTRLRFTLPLIHA